jgi:hypothetical protein
MHLHVDLHVGYSANRDGPIELCSPVGRTHKDLMMLDEPDARVHVNAACVSVCVRGGLSVGRYTQPDGRRASGDST